jgi:ABC-type nitrate/sulfonate/bicarbonate transport system permease component/predicted MFS family arabinose efflux permease
MSARELELVNAENLALEFAAAESDRRLHWFLLLAVLSGITIGMIKAATPLFALSLGASTAEIGLIAGSQPLGMALVSIPVGMAIGWFGARRLFILGSLVGGLIYVLMPFAHTPFWLLAATAAASVFMPMRFVSIHSDYFHHLATTGPAQAGWLRGSQLLGAFVIGPVAGGLLVERFDFLGAYWLIGLSFLLTVFVAKFVLSGKAEARRRRQHAGGRTLLQQLQIIFTHREIVETSLIELVANAGLLFYAVFIVVLAIGQFHYTKAEAAVLLATQGVSYISALFLLGGWLERLGRELFYLLSFGTAILAFLMLGNASGSPQLWVGAILLGFGLGLIGIANVVRQAAISTELGRGNVAGASNLAGPLGAVVATLGGGALSQHIGVQGVFFVLAASTAAAALFTLSTRSRLYVLIGLYRSLLALYQAAYAVQRVAVALLVPAGVLGLWQLASTHGWVSPQILPAPAIVWQTLLDLIQNGDIPSNLAISLGRVLKGFAIGSAIGLFLGFSMGLSKVFEAYVLPVFKALSSVPMLGWLPVVIVLAGIDEALKVIIIAIGCVVPVTLNTFEGVRNIPRGLVEVGRVFQFNDWQLLRKIIIPASVPSIYTGISLALSYAWKALVAVELMASSEGIGFLMVMGRQLFQLDVVLATIIVIGLVGLILDQLLRLSERYFMRWRRGAI